MPLVHFLDPDNYGNLATVKMADLGMEVPQTQTL